MFLRKLELCCTDIFQFIAKLENKFDHACHKEDMVRFNVSFVNDVKLVASKF